MKRRASSISIAVSFLAILALCACGRGHEMEEGKSYRAEALSLAVGADYESGAQWLDGTLYLYDETDGAAIAALDADGALLRRYAVDADEIAAFCPAADGLWLATETRLLRLDANGQTTLDLALPSGLGDVALLSDGERLYLVSGGADACGQVVCLDREGVERFRLSGGDGMGTLCLLDDGRAAVCQTWGGESRLVYLDPARGVWEDGAALSSALTALFDGGRYGTDGVCFYAVEPETGECTRLAAWLELGIDDMVSGVWSLGADAWLVAAENGLFSVSASAAQDGVTVLTLATFDAEAVASAALEFNESQSEYRVELVDYSVYNTASDPSGGLEKLGLDIAAGDAPDVYDLTALPVSLYIQKGLLADLYPFLDADETLAREDLFSPLLAAMETDGALYGVMPHCGLVTMLASPETADAPDAWDAAALLELAAGKDPFAGEITRAEFLAYMLAGNERYVNYADGTCAFDSAEFAALLTLAAALPEETTEDWPGDAHLVCTTLSYDGDWLVADWLLGCLESGTGDAVSLGLPGARGGRVLVAPAPYYWGLSSSGNQTGGWAFIRYSLSAERQAKINSIPLRFDVWQSRRAEAAATKGQMFAATRKGDLSLSLGSTVAMDALEALMSEADGFFERDTALEQIIMDEAAAFFAGDKTAEQTAANIQSRASIYLAEQG